jgi:hypothetical protein
MDAQQRMRKLIARGQKLEIDIGRLVDDLTELLESGQAASAAAAPGRGRRGRKVHSPAPPETLEPRPSARADDAESAGDAFCAAGVARLEIHRRGPRARVLIAGLPPIAMSPQRAALLQALAEPLDGAESPPGERFVPFKTVAQLQRRLEVLTKARLKPHTVVSTISRLRDQSLPYRGLIQTRDSHTSDVQTAYRFVLHNAAGCGQLVVHDESAVDEHPPDFGAIDGATDGDR